VQVGASTSASPSGRLFALRPDGTQRWVFSTPDWVDSTPAIAADGTIYFGCWDGNLHALLPDGTRKWTFAASGFIASSPALGTDGTIYFGAGRGNFYAVDAGGTLRWTFPAADWIDSSAAIGPDGTLYFGSWDNNLYALRPDGTKLWHYATGGNIVSSPALAADGTVYVGSRDQHLYAISAAGTLKWRAALGDTIEASPVLGPDGTIHVATTGGRLFALAADGGERWRYPAAGQPSLASLYSTPAVRADGSLVFGTSDNALHAVRADGTLAWRATLGDWADSSPVVTTDGTIYVGCADKRLYAFASAVGPSLTDWGQFRRDPQRTGRQPLGAAGGTTGRLVNLSVRTAAGTGADTLIVGFVVSGLETRNLLVRGIGPALAAFGVPDALADPAIALFRGAGEIAQNDNWGASANPAQMVATAAAVGAFPLPDGSADAALLGAFAGGYTVHVRDVGGATGVALMEAYDAGGAGAARLANVSARSAVGTGSGVLIAGFVVGESTRAVLVRAVGPTLAEFGVAGALIQPRLQVFASAGRLIAENNGWATTGNSAAIGATALAVGAFPLTAGSRDAALLLTLAPGAYTAQMSGGDGTTGVGLIEVYEVP
jgi:outer membrane protein assembly factor BamB